MLAVQLCFLSSESNMVLIGCIDKAVADEMQSSESSLIKKQGWVHLLDAIIFSTR